MTRRAGAVSVAFASVCCVLLLLLILSTAAAQERSTQTAPAPPEKSKSAAVPEAEKNKQNPVPMTSETIEAGKTLYSSQCAMCHGERGDGKGELVARLKMVIPDLTDPQVQKKRTDGEWFYILGKGHADMPPENRMEPNEKWEIIHYMRTLSRDYKGVK